MHVSLAKSCSFLGPHAEIIGFISHTVLEEVGISYERITGSPICAVDYTCLTLNFRGIQTMKSGNCVIDVTNVDAFKIICWSKLSKATLINACICISKLSVD